MAGAGRGAGVGKANDVAPEDTAGYRRRDCRLATPSETGTHRREHLIPSRPQGAEWHQQQPLVRVPLWVFPEQQRGKRFLFLAHTQEESRSAFRLCVPSVSRGWARIFPPSSPGRVSP